MRLQPTNCLLTRSFQSIPPQRADHSKNSLSHSLSLFSSGCVSAVLARCCCCYCCCLILFRTTFSLSPSEAQQPKSIPLRSAFIYSHHRSCRSCTLLVVEKRKCLQPDSHRVSSPLLSSLLPHLFVLLLLATCVLGGLHTDLLYCDLEDDDDDHHRHHHHHQQHLIFWQILIITILATSAALPLRLCQGVLHSLAAEH